MMVLRRWRLWKILIDAADSWISWPKWVSNFHHNGHGLWVGALT
jgi:hypothetical protein